MFVGDDMSDTVDNKKNNDNSKKSSRLKSILKEYLPYVLIVIVVLGIKHFIISPIKVNGKSMMDTLHHGDIMLLDRISYRTSDIERFDIVVIDTGEEFIIKRIIGLPGERVTYSENQLYINNKKVDDPYATNSTTEFDVTVEEDNYFVLGDNREDSMDSRYFGTFQRDKILGKTNLIIFPFDRFGKQE